MKIMILSLFMTLSFCASAQVLKVIEKKPQTLKVLFKKQIQALEDLGAPPSCETCGKEEVTVEAEDTQERILYTPQEALKDINSGELTYLGRDLFPGSDQNRTCVYKSETAYILYNNCMANKRESEATDIEVISFEGGITRFYILANEGPISELPRSGYDVSWTISSTVSKPPGNLNVSELKDYMGQFVNVSSNGCYIGNTFKSLDMSTKGHCFREAKNNSGNWLPEAEKFWRDPGEEWFKTKKSLRKTVLDTKF